MKSKKIKDYENYLVYEDGSIFSIKSNKYLKPRFNSEGYANVYLHKNGFGKNFKVHRLVAQAFLPNPHNYSEINHIDYDKTNNNIVNLEWCDRSYNVRYSKAKRVKQIDREGNLIKVWEATRDIERYLGINHGSISSCCNGKLMTAGGYIWRYYEN